MSRSRIIGAALAAVLFITGTAFGTLPLITDDTGTQGTGKFQVELGFEHQRLHGDGVSLRVNSFEATFTAGVSRTVDVGLAIPVHVLTASDINGRTSDSGLGDISVETKWRFFESGGFSLAVEPEIFMPSGDSAKGHGNGELAPRLTLIATKELDPLTFHANVGYTRNENDIDQNLNIWHVSFAAEYNVSSRIGLMADAGVDSSHFKQTDAPEPFVIGAVVFKVAENMDIDFGAKGSFGDVFTGWSFLTGTTLRF